MVELVARRVRAKRMAVLWKHGLGERPTTPVSALAGWSIDYSLCSSKNSDRLAAQFLRLAAEPGQESLESLTEEPGETM